MSGIEEVPGNSRVRGYDNGASTWVRIAVNTSGEVVTANGETLYTLQTVYATSASGGTQLGSGIVERIHVRVPEMTCSGDTNLNFYRNSGTAYGIMLGGRSGQAPYISNILSGEPFCVTSGKGIWLPIGSQKDLFVDNVNQIFVCGEPSGYPITFVGEVL